MRGRVYKAAAGIVLACVLGAAAAYAAPGKVIGEIVYPDGPAEFDVRVSDAALMPDGGSVFTGTVAYDNGNRDMLTVRFGPDGSLVWSLAYDETLHDVSAALCLDEEGNVTVAGAVLDLDNPKDDFYDAYYADYRVIRYSPDGRLLFDAGGSGYERSNMPVDVVPAPDGGVFVTGTATNPQESYDFVYTVRYGPDGATQYETFEDFGIETRPAGIALSRGGNLFMTASVYDEFNEYFDIRLVWYDPEDGLFESQLRHVSDYDEFTASDIACDLAGNVVVVGQTGENGGRALALKFSPAGKLLWERVYDLADTPTHADAVTIDPTGRIFVVGGEQGPLDRTDVLLFMLSPDGDILANAVFPYEEMCEPVAVFLDWYSDVNIALTFISPDMPGTARLVRVEGWPMDRVHMTRQEAVGRARVWLHGGVMPVYPPYHFGVAFRPAQTPDGYHFDLESKAPVSPAFGGGERLALDATTLIIISE